MTQLFFSNNLKDFHAQFFDHVGNTIRNHLISLKRYKSLDQSRNCLMETNFNKFSSQSNFRQNSYSINKNKWRISKNKSFNMTNIASLPQQKREVLQRFKKTLKQKLNRKKQMQQIQNLNAHQKIKEMKKAMQSNKQQKKKIFINRKKKEIQLMKSILQRSKGQMNMRKRQRQLQMSFSKWERAQQKFKKIGSIKNQYI